MSNNVNISQAFSTTSNERVSLPLGRLQQGCGAFARVAILGRSNSAHNIVIGRFDVAFAVNNQGVPKIVSSSGDTHLGDTNVNITFAIDAPSMNATMTVQGINNVPATWSISGFLMIS